MKVYGQLEVAQLENYTVATRPLVGKPGRLIYLTDSDQVQQDTGIAWNTLGIGTDGATILTGSGAPAGGLGNLNDLYIDTATNEYYSKTGVATWTLVGDLSGSAGPGLAAGGATLQYARKASNADYDTEWATPDWLTALTGDVTASGPGSVAATIAARAVNFAKFQAITTARLLGRYTALSGDMEEISLAATLAFSGGALGVPDDGISYAKIQNISAASRLLGRGSAGGAGDPEELTLAATLALSGTALGVPDDAITYAKMQNVSAASKILGRGSAAGSGDPQEITLGTGLTMSGTTLNSSGGGGGGSLEWYPFEGASAEYTTENDLPVWKFTDLAAAIKTRIKIPQSYVAGTQIKMYLGMYSPSTSGTMLLTTTTYLVRKNTDAITSTTNSWASSNTALTNTVTNQSRETMADLTSSGGQLNGVAASAGDTLVVILSRAVCTDTAAIRFVPETTEVTFS